MDINATSELDNCLPNTVEYVMVANCLNKKVTFTNNLTNIFKSKFLPWNNLLCAYEVITQLEMHYIQQFPLYMGNSKCTFMIIIFIKCRWNGLHLHTIMQCYFCY